MTDRSDARTSVWDVEPGEAINLSGPASVSLLHKSGRRARLLITAGDDTRIEHAKKDSEASAPAPSLIS